MKRFVIGEKFETTMGHMATVRALMPFSMCVADVELRNGVTLYSQHLTLLNVKKE